VAAAALIGSLSACSPVGWVQTDAVDGLLWRQLQGVRAPLMETAYWSFAEESPAYLAELPGERWLRGDPPPTLESGGVVIYDIASTRTTATFSVFVASGPRPSRATNASAYRGPTEIFTCYRLHTVLTVQWSPAVERIVLDGCPTELVEQLGADAAFARADAFDG